MTKDSTNQTINQSLPEMNSDISEVYKDYMSSFDTKDVIDDPNNSTEIQSNELGVDGEQILFDFVDPFLDMLTNSNDWEDLEDDAHRPPNSNQ